MGGGGGGLGVSGLHDFRVSGSRFSSEFRVSGFRISALEFLSGLLSRLGSLFKLLLIRVPYYIADPRRGPNLENYPFS